jgi:hypothetical protein
MERRNECLIDEQMPAAQITFATTRARDRNNQAAIPEGI